MTTRPRSTQPRRAAGPTRMPSEPVPSHRGLRRVPPKPVSYDASPSRVSPESAPGHDSLNRGPAESAPGHAIGRMLDLIEDAVRVYPKAALFELAEDGYTSAFEQLVACLISIRTRDEQTLPIARRFFARARTPTEVAALTIEEIEALIRPSQFHTPKARQIHAIAERVAAAYGGTLPCDFEVLTSFAGVGPKCANLVLGIAGGQPRIGVDIHVHRVTNRWGYAQGRTPEQTLVDLERRLPIAERVRINRVLVPFGKHICTGRAPRCPTCPVLRFCQRRGDLADTPELPGQAPRPVGATATPSDDLADTPELPGQAPRRA